MTSLTAGSRDKLNVLFIMTDDLNCNLGAYGHYMVKSPNIDRLADQAIVFDNAYCNYPVCGSSRASFMTGLHPDQNGVTQLRKLFRYYVPQVKTMSQHFMENGYVAARVGKIYHYDNPKGIGTNGHDDPESWDIRVNPRGRDKDDEDQIFSLNPGSFGATLSWLAAEGTDEEQTDGKVATESIRLLKQFKESGQPFFLGVGFYKPHTPYVAPEKYFDWYDPDEIEVPRVPADYLSTLPEPAAKNLTRWKHQTGLDDATKRKAIHAYYSTISFLDAQVGRLLDAMEELGLMDDTVILFSSDHGYHMGEHDYFQKTTPFEDADRVPLILYAPGMKAAGQRSKSFVEMIDFYRTLSELAGVSAPPDYVQGMSVAGLLDDPGMPTRDAVLTTLQTAYTLRTERYRYTKWLDTEGFNTELYDRLNDPAEMVNLARDPNYQDVVESMDAGWEAHVERVRSHPEGLEYFENPQADTNLSMEKYMELERTGKLPKSTDRWD